MVLPDYAARRQFVYTTLVQQADSTQAGLRQEFERRGLHYQAYYLVNAIQVDGGPRAEEVGEQVAADHAVVHGQRAPVRRHAVARFVTANTGTLLALLEVHERPHPLNLHEVLVEGLEEQVAYTRALDEAGIPYFVGEFEENMTSFDHLEIQLQTFVENLLFA